MTVKRKDFQKAAAYIHEFLLKLSEDPECAELRDALNLALLYMQKYYRYLQSRIHSNDINRMSGSGTFSVASVRGLSPMTPFRDAPDKFQSRWVNLDQVNVQSLSRSLPHGKENGIIYSIPLMHQACKNCDLDALESLFDKQPNLINEPDSLGRTPMMYGIHYEHNDTVRWLLDHGCDVNATSHDDATALHWACHDGNWQAVDLLLRFQADHRKCDVYGRAPIHWAVTTPTVQCLKLLIHYNANVNIRDKDGLSPSMWACRLDNIEHFSIISQVTNQQIDEPDGMERDLNGRTWLHWAVRRTEPLECLKTLLSEDNVALRDDDGKTVMLIAAETGSLAACRLIVETAGKECIQDRDDQDLTPLHLATIGGHGECVNFLLEMGADTESRDKANATAWDYAHQRHLQYCMLIIASHCRQRGKLVQDTPSSSTLGMYSVPKSANKVTPRCGSPISNPVSNDDLAPKNVGDDVTEANTAITPRRFLSGVSDQCSTYNDDDTKTNSNTNSYLQSKIAPSATEDEPDFESHDVPSVDTDNKPKTPPRPPTTPPPRDKSPTPRRYLKKPTDATGTGGGQFSEAVVNGLNRTISEDESPQHGFDRRESEDLPINSFGASKGLPYRRYRPLRKIRGPLLPPKRIDGSPPLLEANGVGGDDIDHVSIDNMNVSDLDEDGTAPPVTSRRTEPRIPRQPRPSSGRQLTRAQPPPMLHRPPSQLPTSPPSPPSMPRAEITEDESPSTQPPRTPPEAKRKPVLPPQLVPLNNPPKREKKKKKKRRNRDLVQLAMVTRSPVSPPVMEVGGIGLAAASSNHSETPLSNGSLVSGLGGGGSSYVRPLQPPVPAARNTPPGTRLPNFGGGGGSGLEDSTTSLTPRQEVIPPPRGFRNDSSNENTPRDVPSYASSTRRFRSPLTYMEQDARSGNQNKSPLAQLSPNGRAVTAQSSNQRLSYMRRK